MVTYRTHHRIICVPSSLQKSLKNFVFASINKDCTQLSVSQTSIVKGLKILQLKPYKIYRRIFKRSLTVKEPLSGLHTIRKSLQNQDKPWNWYASRIVCRRWFVAFHKTCFTRRTVFVINSKGFFVLSKEVRLRCKTLDNRRIVCSIVFVEFHELTIFSAKLSFHPGFVVVHE